VLPEAHRLRSSTDFRTVVRSGRRGVRPLLTVHLLAARAQDAAGPARAGLVVSKAVGGSVVRHRTARRLRALLLPRLAPLAPGTRLVVRAAPGSGRVPSGALAEDLDQALDRALASGSRQGARR
jgi:ribonuclease P protein component